MGKQTISAVIIAGNEGDVIEGCVRSVLWCDEVIVVVNDNVTDNTLAIARQYTTNVQTMPWQGFSQQKNAANQLANSQWILSIDADERVDSNLKAEIIKTISQDHPKQGYRIPTCNYLLGKRMRYGGWSPDLHIRLFRREDSQWGGEIHEVIHLNGPPGILTNGLIHFSHRNISAMLSKTLKWSGIEAERRYKKNYPRVTTLTFFKILGKELLKRGVWCKGFFDGIEGWIEIFYQAFSSFITYAKLWELQRNKSLEETYIELDKTLQAEGELRGKH
jgi:glycosyltransferase involved in cell wall biosynthesis